MTARQRLDSILAEGRLHGFPPYGCQQNTPAACFSESNVEHLAHLIDLGYEPWGLVFRRQWIADIGGGPIWPVRSEPYGQLTEEQRAWAVRFEPGEADWLHEREWRLPLDPVESWVQFSAAELEAILVADSTWSAPSDGYRTFGGVSISDHDFANGQGDPDIAAAEADRPFGEVPLWRWNPEAHKLER
jgi:hypothetical protein